MSRQNNNVGASEHLSTLAGHRSKQTNAQLGTSDGRNKRRPPRGHRSPKKKGETQQPTTTIKQTVRPAAPVIVMPLARSHPRARSRAVGCRSIRWRPPPRRARRNRPSSARRCGGSQLPPLPPTRVIRPSPPSDDGILGRNRPSSRRTVSVPEPGPYNNVQQRTTLRTTLPEQRAEPRSRDRSRMGRSRRPLPFFNAIFFNEKGAAQLRVARNDPEHPEHPGLPQHPLDTKRRDQGRSSVA